jgi:endonuclease-3
MQYVQRKLQRSVTEMRRSRSGRERVSVGVDAIAHRVRETLVPWILDRLEEAYGSPPPRERLPALDELIVTILSQNTSDLNTDRAYASLRERFGGWEEVMAAPTEDVVDAIRSGGLANQKAPRIQQVLRELDALPHGLSLEWLARLDPTEALSWLTGLHGVGSKTASCVLLFSLRMPVMPVDTHILRIARRLGLVADNAPPERVHRLLTDTVPADRMLDAHLLLIEHGRRTCRARRPRCGECPLAERCPSAFRVG